VDCTSLGIGTHIHPHDRHPLIPIIVGTLRGPEGLHVSMNGGNRAFQLSACSGMGPGVASADRQGQQNVQSELEIGPITIKTITREMLEAWRERVLATVRSEDERRKTLTTLELQQQDLQGLAAGTTTVHAEPVRAVEIALERTETALIALRALAAVNLRGDRVSYCTVLGKEHTEGTSCLGVRDGAIVSYGEPS